MNGPQAFSLLGIAAFVLLVAVEHVLVAPSRLRARRAVRDAVRAEQELALAMSQRKGEES